MTRRIRSLSPLTAADAAWAVLVRRACHDGPGWVIGATGVAMPGLRRAAGESASARKQGLTGIYLAEYRRSGASGCRESGFQSFRAGGPADGHGSDSD